MNRSKVFNLIIFFFLISRCFVLSAQQVTFEKWFDYGFGEEGLCVQQTFDGGYIVAGRQNIAIGITKSLMLKTDSLGNVQWFKFPWDSYENETYAVKQTSDSGFVFTGYTTDSHYNQYIHLIRTAANGDTIWTKRFFPPVVEGQGEDIVQTSDGGFLLLTVGADSTDTLSGAIYLIKTNSLGDTSWTHKYKSANNDYIIGLSLKSTNDNGYIIAGNIAYNTIPVTKHFFLMKTDSIGDTLWTRIFTTSFNHESANSVCETFDKGYVLFGDILNPFTSTYDIYVVKTDSMGILLWTKTIGGMQNEAATSGVQCMDSGFAVTGITTTFGNGDGDVYLVKLNTMGDTVWSRTFGTPDIEVGNYLQQTADGGFVLTGRRELYLDAYLIKTDPIGNLIISTPELSHSVHFSVFPNPASAFVTFDYSFVFLKKKIIINISDITDHIIDQIFISDKIGQTIWDTRKIASGIYLYRVTSEGSVIATGKIAVQKL